MKPLRQISAVMILSLSLSVSVFAGQIEVNGVVAPQQPPPSASTQSAGTATSILLKVLSLIRR